MTDRMEIPTICGTERFSRILHSKDANKKLTSMFYV